VLLFALLAFPLAASAGPDAALLLQNGRANEALQVLNSQVQNNPNDARAYNLICRVYFQLEHWDDAIHAAERSVALDSQESEYHQWLARAYGRKAEAAGAVTALTLVRKVKAEFEKAVALDQAGKNLSARADLAEFYIDAPYIMGGDKTKAKHLADFIMNQDPALAHYVRGQLEEKQNAKEHAEEEYKAAIEASGNRAHYWVMLATFYRRSGRLDEMEAAIAKSLSAPRKDGIPLFDGASALLTAGRNFQGAIRMLRQYLSLDDPAEDGPAFQAHYFLGLLLEKQRDLKAAAGEYRAALALASEYRPAQEALARVTR
jgi:tetratricopeptide (TPR) repeat protein